MGILVTMLTSRSRNEKQVLHDIQEIYGEEIPVFASMIPRSVQAGESNYNGVSIHLQDPKGKIAEAYRGCVKEVLHGGV